MAIPKAWLIAPSAAGVLLLSATSAPEARGKDQACYELLLPRAIEP